MTTHWNFIRKIRPKRKKKQPEMQPEMQPLTPTGRSYGRKIIPGMSWTYAGTAKRSRNPLKTTVPRNTGISNFRAPYAKIGSILPRLYKFTVNQEGVSHLYQPKRIRAQLVDCSVVIGDSSVDCRTNNFLLTFARADRLPFGRDFDTHQPTGGFCRIPVDYLALRLGLLFVPSYIRQASSVEDMKKGVNYASAGAGIIFSSGSELGQHISLNQKIQQVCDTIEQFKLNIGGEATSELIAKSVFNISIGTNDYIHFYLRNVSDVQSSELPWNFNQFLAHKKKQEIKGQHIFLTQQIQQEYDTIEQFNLDFGEEATSELIAKSVFCISTGTNDYIHFYLRNVSDVQSSKLPWNFNQFLAQTMKQEIKNLRIAGVRRVIVMGLTPIGCAPFYLWQYHSRRGKCVDEMNNMILVFNFALRYMVHELNEELVDSSIIFCAAFQGSMDIMKNHRRFGFKVVTDACCGLGRYRGWITCLSPEMACANASTRIWWDQFHPTDAVNEILAENVWSSFHSNTCYPMNLQDMIARGHSA